MLVARWKRWILSSLLTVAACSPEPLVDVGEPASCEVPDKNEWLYALMQEAYLWNTTLPEVDPATYESPQALLRDLRYTMFDRWSRISDKATTNALFMEGKAIGTGFRTLWDLEERLRVASVQMGTPAAAAGLVRGDEIVAVAGIPLATLQEQDLWDQAWGPNEPGVTFTIDVRSADGTVSTRTITREWIELQTVPDVVTFDHGGRRVGYLHFTSFLAPSEAELRDAFHRFKTEGIRELVVDMRYNGGGLVSIARYLMNLIAANTAPGAVSYRVVFNENLASNNEAHELDPNPESLLLDHVVFLVSGATASASELVINAVRAHVPVTLVGTPTAGKPVGSNMFEFCDSIASPITFELRNANHEGAYYDGLAPNCTALDDVDHPLGDPDEALMAQALALLDTQACLPSEDRRGSSPTVSSFRAAPARPAPLHTPGLEELRGWM